MDTQTLFYILYGLLFLFIVAFVIAGKFVKFGVQYQIYKKRWGEGNVGLIFTRSMGNNFGIPEFIKLDDNVKQDENTTKVYQREQFIEGSFFGLPYIFVDAQDTKTSYGLYKRIMRRFGIVNEAEKTLSRAGYFKEVTDENGNKTYTELSQTEYQLMKHQCDTDGEPLYHHVPNPGVKDAQGNQVYLETKIPVLDKVKSSVTLDPGLIRKSVVNMALSEAINEFLKKHKILLTVMGLSALAAGVAAFFAYNNQNAISQLCVANLPQWKSDVINACTNALQNLTVVKK